jgi:outer membrane protein TolC
LLISVLLLMAVSCSRQVKKPPMPTKIPSSFTTTGVEPLPDSWWLSFEDDGLNVLIEQALKDSFDLAVAWDRLAQAEAVAKKSDASLLPRANLEAGFRRSRQETQSSTVYSTLYSLGIAASYEVDLWSRDQVFTAGLLAGRPGTA